MTGDPINSLKRSYGFFDDRYTMIENGYSGEDLMSPKQFAVMGTVFVLIVLASLLLRRVKREKLFLIYKVIAVVMPFVEVVKVTYSSYFDILNGQPFDWGGILPFYTCSMMLYFLPFVAWGRGGMMQRVSMAFFTNIGLIAGLSNFVFLSSASFFPILSFSCFYSISFHALLVFVGMSLLITGEVKPSLRTALEGTVPVLIFSAFVIPINFIIKRLTGGWVDYMMLMRFNDFPVLGDLAHFLESRGLLLLFSLFVLLLLYPLASLIITWIEIGAAKAVSAVKAGRDNRRKAPKAKQAGQ